MARVCTICSSAKLLSIDRHILRGDTLNAIARRFRVSPDAVGRHRRHMATAILKAQRAAEPELAYGQSLIEEVRAIKGDIERMQSDAERRRDVRAALLAVRERLTVVELEAKLTGQIDSRQKNELHLHVAPDRALAIAEAYVARHRAPNALPELQAMPQVIEGEEIQ